MAAIVPHVLVVATNIPEYPVSVTVTVCASELPVPKNASNAGLGDGADAGDGVGDAVGVGVAVGVGDATGIDMGISDEVTCGVGYWTSQHCRRPYQRSQAHNRVG